MNLDLCYLSARECLNRFRRGSLSPVELLDALIERAEALEPRINAFSFTYFEEAREQAKRAERAWRNGTARPLEGIPVAIKDEPMIEGRPTTNGSLLLEGYVADYTDPLPQRLQDAGAIIHARTTTPEFSMSLATWSTLWGVTRNPWNPGCTPGGSSGGAAAALAAGTTILASGSDIAGSIRIPAALTGTVGFKAPWGRVPEVYPWNRESFAQSGGLARSVGDMILMQNVIAGPHPYDLCSLPAYTLPERQASIAGMRIALCPDLGIFAVDPEVRQALAGAAEALRDLGADVEVVNLDWPDEAGRVIMQHLMFQAGSVFHEQLGDDIPMDKLTSYAREIVEGRAEVSFEDEKAGWRIADTMLRELQDKVFLAGFDALVCPTMATTRIPADYDQTHDVLTVDGRQADGVTGLCLTYPFNILNRFPVLSVPVGAGANHVPIGMQIVAPSYDDATAFRIAGDLEHVLPPPFAAGRRPILS